MDPDFLFPRTQNPIPRPPRAHATNSRADIGDGDKRDSNALRASVLDVVLQLGLGTNKKVAEWMFNNPVEEEDVEDEFSPPLTSGSTGTSDEYVSPFPSLPDRGVAMGTAYSMIPLIDAPHKPRPSALVPTPPFDYPEFVTPPAPLVPVSKGKLRKKRNDGYESDGAFVADMTRKSRKKSAKDEDDGIRSKIFFGRQNKKPLQTGKPIFNAHASGYETDGPIIKSSKSKKLKIKSADDTGYDTESGYASSSTKGKSKARFFGKGKKKPNFEVSLEPPPLPYPSFLVEKYEVSLPIASKFATPTATSTDNGDFTSVLQSQGARTLASLMATRSSQDRPTSSFLSMTPSPISPIPALPGAHPISSQLQSLASRHSSGGSEPRSLSRASQSSHSSTHRSASTGGSVSSRSGVVPVSAMQPNSFSTLPRSASSPARPISTTIAPTVPVIGISPTLSETTLAAISGTGAPISTSQNDGQSSVATPESLVVPSFSPGQILRIPPQNSELVPDEVASFPPSPTGQLATHWQPPLSPGSAQPSPSSPASLLSAFPKIPQTVPSIVLPKILQPASREPNGALRPGPLKSTTDDFDLCPATSPQNGVPKKTVAFANNTVIIDSPEQGDTPRTRGRSASDETIEMRMTRPGQERRLTKQVSLPQIQPNAFFPARTHSQQPRVQISPPRGGGLASPNSLARQAGTALPRAHRQLRLQVHSPDVRPQQSPSSSTLGDTLQVSPPAFPSERYIIRSRSPSPLLSPRVLAYYDIPPPSPPPVGPLPSVPKMQQQQSQSERGRTRLTQLRTAVGGDVRRGKESPFPQRPIRVQDSAIGKGGFARTGQGLDVPRYRELHALALPVGSDGMEKGVALENWRSPGGDGYGEGYEGDNQPGGVQELSQLEREISGRLEASNYPTIAVYGTGSDDGLEQDREMNSEKHEDRRHGENSASRRTSSESGGGERSSRWSGSIYSRGSFLDPDKSEEARMKFLKGVEEMYFVNGRERAIPPVPKLPDMLSVGGNKRNWF